MAILSTDFNFTDQCTSMKYNCENTVQDMNVCVRDVVQLILDKIFKILKVRKTTLSFTEIATLQDTDVTLF
jgi:hypothetical protein